MGLSPGLVGGMDTPPCLASFSGYSNGGDPSVSSRYEHYHGVAPQVGESFSALGKPVDGYTGHKDHKVGGGMS